MFNSMRSSIFAELNDESIFYFVFKFLNIFTPRINKQFTFQGNLIGKENKYAKQDIKDYLNQFENSFPITFCKYLFINRKELKEEIDNSVWVESCGNYDIFDLFKMAETIL